MGGAEEFLSQDFLPVLYRKAVPRPEALSKLSAPEVPTKRVLAMKHSILFAALGLVAFGAAAQEVGQVLSSTPVIQQVAVPRQVCTQGYVAPQPQATSGGGGLLGAIIGAGVGSAIGHGAGTAAAMGVGTIAGAIIGNNVEANNNARYAQAVPTCTTETTYENRTVAYNVTYEYQGRQYQTQMPYDPGATVRLNAPAVSQGPAVNAPPVYAQGTVVQQAPVIVQAPAPVVYQPYAVYPAYPAYPAYGYPVYRPYYPPVGVSLGFVFSSGGHRHHRWR
jgi:uncharacterized protein YcfJ